MKQISKVLLILFFVVIAIIGVFTLIANYNQFQNGSFSTTLDSDTELISPNAQICKANKGIWYIETRVCEVSEETCSVMGGQYDQCAISICKPSEEVTETCEKECKGGCEL